MSKIKLLMIDTRHPIKNILFYNIQIHGDVLLTDMSLKMYFPYLIISIILVSRVNKIIKALLSSWIELDLALNLLQLLGVY